MSEILLTAEKTPEITNCKLSFSFVEPREKSWLLFKEHRKKIIPGMFVILVLWLIIINEWCSSVWSHLDSEPGFIPFMGIVFIIVSFIGSLPINAVFFSLTTMLMALIIEDSLNLKPFTWKQVLFYLSIGIIICLSIIAVIQPILEFPKSFRKLIIYATALWVPCHSFIINALVLRDISGIKKYWKDFFRISFLITGLYCLSAFLMFILFFLLNSYYFSPIMITGILFTLLAFGFWCLLLLARLNIFVTLLFLSGEET